MTDELTFAAIREKALNMRYHAFEYADYDGCRKCTVLTADSGLVLLLDSQKNMLYWAADDLARLAAEVGRVPGRLIMGFVSAAVRPVLKGIGFEPWAEYVDLFNADLHSTVAGLRNGGKAMLLTAGSGEALSALSHKCAGQSRGFGGESPGWFEAWMKSNAVIGHYQGGQLAGYCCVGFYGMPKTLWIREVAVAPGHQGRGIGRSLVEKAVCFGAENGAAKGFLACDVLNSTALKIYLQCGFIPAKGESELQMIRCR